MPYTDPSETRELCRAYYHANREKILAQKKNYYAANREKIAAKDKAYRAANGEKIRTQRASQCERIAAWHRDYRVKHRSELNQHEKERYQTDPDFRIAKTVRIRVRAALRGIGTKSADTLGLLGCDIPALRAHLEKRFRPGMTWENYGPVWHVDHIKPCAKFDLTDPVQQRECFCYTNTQPLFAGENRRKWAK